MIFFPICLASCLLLQMSAVVVVYLLATLKCFLELTTCSGVDMDWHVLFKSEKPRSK